MIQETYQSFVMCGSHLGSNLKNCEKNWENRGNLNNNGIFDNIEELVFNLFLVWW